MCLPAWELYEAVWDMDSMDIPLQYRYIFPIAGKLKHLAGTGNFVAADIVLRNQGVSPGNCTAWI